MWKRIFILTVLVYLNFCIENEAQNYCSKIDQIKSKFKPYLVRTGVPFLTPCSKIEFYKENISTNDKDEYTISPIITTDKGDKIGKVRWFAEDNAIIDTIFTTDLDNDKLNELIFIIKSEGYLREYSTSGNILEVFALSGHDFKNSSDPCFIPNFPFINQYFSVIRIAKVNDKDSCNETFCTKRAIVNEIIRLSKMPTNQLFSLSYKFALNAFKGKSFIDAASISSIALVFPNLLSNSTINIFNDMGFFKEQGKDYRSAILILKLIVERYPSRTVAYLNLADAYWGIDDKASAKESYQTYANLMKKEGKEKKIPSRVYERMKQ